MYSTMSTMINRKQFRTLLIVMLLTGLLGYLLFWRYRVSVTRLFDIDEFSYMHWTAQVARGERPYVDFISYFTPGFMWAFAPIFWIYGVSVNVFTAARSVSFVIFLGILGSLGYLYGITRGWRWALLPVVILAFLPMPYDKFLEIRPDNLATLLALIGVIGEVIALMGKSRGAGSRYAGKKIWWLVSGFAYSASLFVLAKTLPIVAVGAGIAVLSAWKDRKKFLFFLLGLLGPWVLFFSGAAVFGHFSAVWYSLTTLPLEVSKSAVNYHMEANLFFYPNDWFYGLPAQAGGITLGLIVNHAIWIVALVVGTYRLVTPIRDSKKNNTLIELLVAGVFFVSIAAYVKFFPLKHSQYLIPIAVFVAYFAADGLENFFDWLIHAGGFASFGIIFLGFAYILVVVMKQVNTPKLKASMSGQLNEISALIRVIPLPARVVDLEGRMVFWPDGYPISSLPFDGFLSYVSRPPESLNEYLAKHPAEYIYDGDSNRMATLTTENLAYIRAHFAPVREFGGRLWKRL